MPDGQWVHTATASLGISVCNIVITDYEALDTPLPGYKKDAFLYDPNDASPLCNPSFKVTLDNWKSEPMEIVVWLMATVLGDTRPDTLVDPYMSLPIPTPGMYNLTWDGSNPGIYGPGEAPWGTYTYDADVYKPSRINSMDHFFAKTHDGWNGDYQTGVVYDTTFGTHSVQWTRDDVGDPMVLRCTYQIGSHSNTAPAWVKLVAVDPDLSEQGTTINGATVLDVTHDASPPTGDGSGPGIATYSTPNPDDTVGTWRVVLIGETNAGANLRRDGENPIMLATNDPYFQECASIFLNKASDGGIITTSPADPSPTVIAQAISDGLKMRCFWYVRDLTMYMFSNDGTRYPSLKGGTLSSHTDWGFLLGTPEQLEQEKDYRRSIRHAITVSQRVFPADVTGVGAGYGENYYYGFIYRPDVTAIDTAKLKAHTAGPAPANDAQMAYATTHAILHELGHRLGLQCHTAATGDCVMDEAVEAFLYTNRFVDVGWQAEMWGGFPHIYSHRTQISAHLYW